MEEAVQRAAIMDDKKAAMDKKAEVEERVRKLSSDLRRETVDLEGAENITELHRRRNTFKKSSSRGSAEGPALGPVSGATEFMNAATQGELSVVEKYLADGGNPNVYDEFRRTALHHASFDGHTAVVSKLLEKGADIHFKDRLDSRAIHWACRGGRLQVVKTLKSHGADLNVRDKRLAGSRSPTPSGFSKESDLEPSWQRGHFGEEFNLTVDSSKALELHSTPLHVATRTGHADIAEYLLSCGVKINCRDREGDTALHDAVRLNRYKIVKLLIVAGADTKIKNHQDMMAVEQVKQWQFDTMETFEKLEQLKEAGLLPLENAAIGEE